MKRAYEKLCNYTQQCPVTFGVGSISTVKDAMGMLGVKKLFVVYDQGVKMSGLAEKVTKSLDEQGIDYIAYDDNTRVNGSSEEANSSDDFFGASQRKGKEEYYEKNREHANQ